MKFAVPFVLLITALASTPALAQLSGEGDLAISRSDGNTESSSLSAGLSLVYQQDRWQHKGSLDAYSASQEGDQTAESYQLKLNSHYEFSERAYAFGDGRYLNDRFSAYDYQATLAFGMGRTFVDNGTTLLEAETGLGYRISDPAGNEEEDSAAIVLAQATFNHQLTETTAFTSDYRVETGSDNTHIQADLGLKVAIVDSLAVRLAYVVKHNTQVPAGTENTDTLTTVGLNYSF